MQKRPSILPAALFLVLGILLTVFWLSTRTPPQGVTKNISVEVIHADGSEASFSYVTDHNYLGNLLEEEGLISGSDSPFGLFVETVDGETANYAEDGSWWQLLCNGEEVPTGVDGVTILDGAVYSWIFTAD